MHNIMEIASYLPKLEKLASSLTAMGPPSAGKPLDQRKRNKNPRRPSKKKVVLVKKLAVPEVQPNPTTMMPFHQPGMVYVPASWLRKSIKRKKTIDLSAKHTFASLAKKRLASLTEQNVLLQQKHNKNKVIRKRMHHFKLDKPSTDLAMSVDARRAVLALEKKRLEFLQYLQEVQDEISALDFVKGKPASKQLTKMKKRDALTVKSKSAKVTESTRKPATKSKGKTVATSRRKVCKVEYTKNSVKPVQSKVVLSKHSLTSMLSQDSSSSTQIRMMDDAFNTKHRNYNSAMNESKQTRINVRTTSIAEPPGFFQWNPIPHCRSTNSAIKIVA